MSVLEFDLGVSRIICVCFSVSADKKGREVKNHQSGEGNSQRRSVLLPLGGSSAPATGGLLSCG